MAFGAELISNRRYFGGFYFVDLFEVFSYSAGSYFYLTSSKGVSMAALICSVILSAIIWYVYYGLESFLNGGNLGRHWFWFPMQCLWQEVQWNFSSGRANCIREIVASGDGVIMGSKHSWHYADIREQNLYNECGRDCLPGLLHLVLCITIPFALGFGVVGSVTWFISHL